MVKSSMLFYGDKIRYSYRFRSFGRGAFILLTRHIVCNVIICITIIGVVSDDVS